MTDAARTFETASCSGVAFSTGAALAVAERESTANGLQVARIDLRGCCDKSELLRRIARALDTPAELGRNWDALADQLRDLGWLPQTRGRLLLFAHADGFARNAPADFAILLEILAVASHYWQEQEPPLRSLIAPMAAQPALQGNSLKPR